MVIGIIGESCTGKSTLAEALSDRISAEVITGKDFLRLAKCESDARALFSRMLSDAVHGGNIIYVISDEEHLGLLPDGAVRILAKADITVIKERFRNRMHGNLPKPVEIMLEKKHGMFDDCCYDFIYDSTSGDCEGVLGEIVSYLTTC